MNILSFAVDSGIEGVDFFVGVVFPLVFVILIWQHLHNSIHDMVSGVTLSQPAERNDPVKSDPNTIKPNYIQRANINA